MSIALPYGASVEWSARQPCTDQGVRRPNLAAPIRSLSRRTSSGRPVAQLHDFGRLAACQGVSDGTGDPIGGRQQRIVNYVHVAAGHRPARVAQHGRDGRLGASQRVGGGGEAVSAGCEELRPSAWPALKCGTMTGAARHKGRQSCRPPRSRPQPRHEANRAVRRPPGPADAANILPLSPQDATAAPQDPLRAKSGPKSHSSGSP